MFTLFLKFLIVIATIIIAFFLRIAKKNKKLNFSYVSIPLSMYFNTVMILIMLLTIIYSNKSINENIKTIENSTQKRIEALNVAERNKKKALLQALIFEFNHNIQEIEHNSKMWNRVMEDIKIDSKKFRVPATLFIDSAYKANLNNGTIDEGSLLVSLQKAYTTFNFFQKDGELFMPYRNITEGERKLIISQTSYHIETLESKLEEYKRIKQEIISFMNKA